MVLLAAIVGWGVIALFVIATVIGRRRIHRAEVVDLNAALAVRHPEAHASARPDLAAMAADADRDGMPCTAGLYRQLDELWEKPPATPSDDRLRSLEAYDDRLAARMTTHSPPWPCDDFDLEYDRQRAARERMRETLRPATPVEYQEWLTRWAKAGGRVVHRDRPMRDVWVATGDMHIEPLHGACAFGIILVPRGVKVRCTEPGHTDVVWMDSTQTVTFHGRPMYQAESFSDVPVHSTATSR